MSIYNSGVGSGSSSILERYITFEYNTPIPSTSVPRNTVIEKTVRLPAPGEFIQGALYLYKQSSVSDVTMKVYLNDELIKNFTSDTSATVDFGILYPKEGCDYAEIKIWVTCTHSTRDDLTVKAYFDDAIYLTRNYREFITITGDDWI